MIAPNEFAELTEELERIESSIDDSDDIYMLTWSPDPKELPDADIHYQHYVNVSILTTFLKCCKTGIFCVEVTQLGNPHYHGWYQVADDDTELGRIAVIKVMQRFGICKLAKVRTSYKIFNWNKHGNALYYYKSDLFTFHQLQPNPITKDTVLKVDPRDLDMISFLTAKKNTIKYAEKVSNIKFFEDFYKNTGKVIH